MKVKRGYLKQDLESIPTDFPCKDIPKCEDQKD
jgi:hypothetical protein